MLGFGSFFKLFACVVPFDLVVFMMEGFDEDTHIIVPAKEMLVFLFRLGLELLADGVKLLFSIGLFS